MKNCPVCKSPHNPKNVYISVNGWKINQCSNFDLLFTDINRRIDKASQNFYNQQYIQSYKAREYELKRRFRRHLTIIERYKRGGKLLDIGCGLGYFIATAEKSDNFRWNVAGLECNKKLIESASSKVRRFIRSGLMSDLPFKNDTFDCVTCFDVLEHDFRLHRNLLEIKRVMKKNGILVIQAPNYKSLMAFLTKNSWSWWAPPDHVLHLSFNFLTTYLTKNNFKILEKLTYEKPSEFLANIKGRLGKNIFFKFLFYIICPLLLVIEVVGWRFNLGALSFVVAKKES
ncbi:MAG: class I SAM-dependent methyltransferase [bacterium]|nr:class I SAM-dependent methyltransferase [bacterium]